MKTILQRGFFLFLSLFLGLYFFVASIEAQTTPTLTSLETTEDDKVVIDASEAALLLEMQQTLDDEASQAAIASSSTLVNPEVKQTIQEKKEQDLTETTGKKTDSLTQYVEDNAATELNWYNWLQFAVRQAISHGLPANIIVLLIMFPLVACLIAFSRHVIGLRGFGIYAPAVLSVAFVSTGIDLGVVVFVIVVFLAILFRNLLKKASLPYLPKTALLLWGTSIGVLVLLLGASLADWQFFLKISIFPLLIIILLSENFMETQLISNSKEALKLTVETILTAIVCALLISNETLQKLVILNPGLTLGLTALANVLIGKFTGLRFLEYLRFKSLLKNKK